MPKNKKSAAGDFDPEQFLTKLETADLLKISCKTVDRWDRTGYRGFPRHYRIGERKKWKRAEVVAWANAQKEERR